MNEKPAIGHSILALAFALGSAEAGDEFGDSASDSSEVDGALADMLAPPDSAIVQSGTSAGGGSVTVDFDDNVAYDGAGADIRVYTEDAVSPSIATIEVSAGGVPWVTAGDFEDTSGNIDIELGTLGLEYAVAVRITHVSGELPGFDLDAIEALSQIDLDDVVLTLDLTVSEHPGFTEHTVTANLTDASVPVAGAVVFFLVSAGSNVGQSGTATTCVAAGATFSWTGDSGPSLDVIEA